MTTEEFEQNLIIALASNPEFIKQAGGNYDGKQIWFAVTEQINSTVNGIKKPVTQE